MGRGQVMGHGAVVHAYHPPVNDRRVRFWAWVGLAAQVLLIVSWIAAGFWQGPRYSIVSDSISDLYAATAPAGLPLAIVIGLCGLATILFAWLSVWPSLRGAGARAAIGSALLGASIYGLGDLLAPVARVACRIADEGCSPSDQLATFGGLLDAISSIPGILLFIVAIFVLAAAMARTPEWRDLAVLSRRLGFVSIALLIVAVLGSAMDATGLATRVFAIAGAAGIAALAWRIARSAPSPSAS
jgi:hypothetical protein